MPRTFHKKAHELNIGAHRARWCCRCKTWLLASEFRASSELCGRYHGRRPGCYERRKLAEYARGAERKPRKIDGAPGLLNGNESSGGVPRNTVARRR